MNASPSMPHVDESTRRHAALRNTRVIRALAAASLVAALGVAHAQNVAARNGLLTDADGKTLYTFDQDASGRSNCTGACAVAWPPFVAAQPPRDNGAFTQIMREDGRLQWARDGKPLYFFASDAQPGDAKGDGMSGAWHVVKLATPRAAASSYDSSSYYRY